MVVQSQHPIPVPFRGATLYIIDIAGDPYTPMKPIVEGMGLTWHGQFEKLNKERWSTCIRVIRMQMPGDDQLREVLCLSLRKLPGWLMTIQPSRLKPEIRDTIIAYQNECDDVLWQYWTQGHVVNPRMDLPQDYYSDLRTIADATQALANTVRALVDKYASHATSELSPNSLTCQHIVNCEQRTQPQLLKPTASPSAITSQAPPCADSIFLTVLRESLESQPFTANKLYLIIVARQYPALTDAAVNLLGDVTTWSARKLGQILGRWSRSELSCYRVLNLGPSKNGVLWRLEQVS